MLAVLLIGGVSLLLAGLLAVGLGIPVKEFSFGNTMILAGAIVGCTGVLMIAIWTAVRELKKAVRQFGPGITAASNGTSMPASGSLTSPGIAPPEEAGSPIDGGQAAEWSEQSETLPHSSWLEQPEARERGALQNQEPIEPNPTAKPRRNLLFASTSRRERERTQGQMSESSLGDFSPGTPLRSSQESAREGSTETLAQSEDVWAKPGRGRSSEASSQRRSSRVPPSSQPASRTEDQPAVTVLKSGEIGRAHV